MFCGSEPVSPTMNSSDRRETTRPITRPSASISGPPLLPGCTGAVKLKKRPSSFTPESALTLPPVRCSAVPTML